MTDEQIKQKAEEYADVFGRHMVDHYGVKDAFTAGAHSRDAEIEQLEERIKVLDMNLVEQQLENQQLRNPWISVEERLPDDMKKVIWLRKDGQYFFGHFHNHDNGRSTEAVTDVTGEWRDRVTHWMPIPELKKGGEG